VFDGRIIDPWPTEVVEALDDLRQGDVIPWPIDTAYVTTDRFVLYGQQPEPDAQSSGEQELVALDPPPELAVITTQTCDVDEQGHIRRKPWIQYAPCSRRRRTRASGACTPLPLMGLICLGASGTPT
jgi:hypothetical protein